MTAKTKSAAKRKAVGAKSKRPKLALQEQIDLLAGLAAKLAKRVSALECPSPLLLDIEADVKKLSYLYASLPRAGAEVRDIFAPPRIRNVTPYQWSECPVCGKEVPVECNSCPICGAALRILAEVEAREAAQSGVSPSAPADLASDPKTIAMHDLRKP